MKTVSFGDKSYELDDHGYLLDFDKWDEDFARKMAIEIGIGKVLTSKHWAVINFIRESFRLTGQCPLVYVTCRANHLTWRGLQELFPAGYHRGACLLAGITYEGRLVNYFGERDVIRALKPEEKPAIEKIYQVDRYGFLVNPAEWDEEYAVCKATEMKMPTGLSGKHWQIIHFIREYYEQHKAVPTIFECCGANGLEIDDLASLFPDGYQRGAVKIAGLRLTHSD